MHFYQRILIMTAFSACLPIAAFAQDRPRFADTPSITVLGHAHETRVPDEASTTAALLGSGATPDAAIRDLAPLTAKVVDIIKQAGIADGDTDSAGPDIEPLYKRTYDAQGREVMEKREPNGFRATYRLTFKTKNLDTLGKLIPMLTEAKATIDHVNFMISDEKALRRSLEDKAVADAVARAKEQIHAAGAKPGRILEIGFAGQEPVPLFKAMRALPSPALASAAPINLTFALRPGKQDVEVERQVVMEILQE